METRIKCSGLESEMCTKKNLLTCILLLWRACKRVFSQRLLIGMPSKMCRQPSHSPSLPSASCLDVSRRNQWKSCGERAKPVSWSCVMLVGPLKAWENGFCSCWKTWPWSWVLQKAAALRQTATTLDARFVSSPLPSSPSLSANGLRQKITQPTNHLFQSVTARICILMSINVRRLQRS